MQIRYFSLIFFALLCSFSFLQSSENSSLYWHTNYKKAVEVSKAENKPLILYFTGSDWCPFCLKMDQEILGTARFAEMTKDQFVFMEVDFPQKTPLPLELAKQNKRLKRRFSVMGYPTLVILDTNQEKIASRGYLPTSPEKYAQHLLSISADFQQIENLAQDIPSSVEDEDLRSLYKKAQRLQKKEKLSQLLNAGLKRENNLFFLCEKYRQLVNEGKKNQQETINTRKEILSKDPNNKMGKQRFIAMVDFEELTQTYEKGQDFRKVTEPLVSYLKKFGDEDADNAWYLRLALSEFLYNEGEVGEALGFAQKSLQTAPRSRQAKIREMVENLNQEIQEGLSAR